MPGYYGRRTSQKSPVSAHDAGLICALKGTFQEPEEIL
jgi:hypothetical protein